MPVAPDRGFVFAPAGHGFDVEQATPRRVGLVMIEARTPCPPEIPARLRATEPNGTHFYRHSKHFRLKSAIFR